MSIIISPAPPTSPNLNDPATFNDRALAMFSWITDDLVSQLAALDGLGYGAKGAPLIMNASANYTPPSDVRAILIQVQGAGGAGGGTTCSNVTQAAAGTGGSSGGFVEGFYELSGPVTFPMAVGAGGQGVTGAAGGDGGGTTFGAAGGFSELYANGGYGGFAGQGSAEIVVKRAKGTSDNSSGGDVTVQSQFGGSSFSVGGTTQTSQNALSGGGGHSRFGSGAFPVSLRSASNAVADGFNGSGKGSGGGGSAQVVAGTADMTGGNGANGVILIWEFQ